VRRLLLLVVAGACLSTVVGCGQIEASGEVLCRPGPPTALLAESVPTADRIPCVRELPAGWSIDRFVANDQGGSFVVSAGGDPWVTVGFHEECEVAGRSAASDEEGAERWIEMRNADPYRSTWRYRFPGGCATYDIVLPGDVGRGETLEEITSALSFMPRGALADELARRGATT
jgi:hypothetical protein